MKQKELVLEWIAQKGFILPARMSGVIFMGYMFGSETSKRCREMRKEGILESEPEGKFEIFRKKTKSNLFS